MLDGELVGIKLLSEKEEDGTVADLKLTKTESTRFWRTQEVPQDMQIVGIKCHI